MAKKEAVDQALAHVGNGRRGFLKGLLIGSAALAALPLMKSQALAQGDNDNKGKKGKKGKKGDDNAGKHSR